MPKEEKIIASLQDNAFLVRNFLRRLLSDKSINLALLDAISYGFFTNGKMIRAYLVKSFCQILEIPFLIEIATSIELIHCYSLIHDDLPSMDDDNYRRGNLTLHKKFNEATAILVGDALQPLAFEIISNSQISAEISLKLILQLASAIGAEGMVAGQYLDMFGKKNEVSDILELQYLKTGKLIEYSCIAPCIAAISSPEIMNIVMNYAKNIGLAYQIKDDLLDVTGNENSLGKAVSKDHKKGKITLLEFFSIKDIENQLASLIMEAISLLENFGSKADNLKDFTNYLLQRQR